MTKTFTEKGIEYLLVEVDNPMLSPIFNSDRSKWKQMFADSGYWDWYRREVNGEIISLLKDITEEQAKEIIDTEPGFSKMILYSALRFKDIDTSLNWLLLKKI